MAAEKYPQALVVDDETIIRRLVARALVSQGFRCDMAADGDEAARLIAAQRYDVLITDLKMPNRNGHVLIREVLLAVSRPVIIVHTGVVEPKLARDLLFRGVDDIVYKPCDPLLLAAKAKALVQRRDGELHSGASVAASPPISSLSSRLEGSGAGAEEARISAQRLNERLADVEEVLPISRAALDVYHMTRTCDWEISQIAAAIQRDASLTAEVLRLANSSFYNVTAKRIVDLDRAVMSIGQTRIGELALALNALSAVTSYTLPWMNLDLAWRRSLAAGVAVEALVELGGHNAVQEGLPLSATMHLLGRVVLAAAFPKIYHRMVDQCCRTEQALRDVEGQALPTPHSAVLAQLLTGWRIPPDVCLPLKHAADDFPLLARLAEPDRTRTELLKLAILVGRLAIGPWEPWDTVEFVPATVLERLKTPIVDDLIAKIRSDALKLVRFSPGGNPPSNDDDVSPPLYAVAYCNVANSYTDLLAELLPALGFQPRPVCVEELRQLDEPAIINGVDSPASRFAAYRGRGEAIVITTGEKVDAYAKFGRTVALPCSFAHLRNALNDLIGATAPRPQLTGAGG